MRWAIWCSISSRPVDEAGQVRRCQPAQLNHPWHDAGLRFRFAVPLINVRTSLASVDNADALLKELSAALAQQTGKPESYVMTMLETAVPMTFAASSEPSVFVEIKSIGSLRPPAMTAAFGDLISARTGIPTNRIYIQFEDVAAASWGWDGRTFG